jgi:hypothetical protein
MTERDYLEQIWRQPIVHTCHINVWTCLEGDKHLAPFIWASRGRLVAVVARARRQSPPPART